MKLDFINLENDIMECYYLFCFIFQCTCFLSSSKKFIVKTKIGFDNQTTLTNQLKGNDYMASSSLQVVDIGSSVVMKCNSPKNIERCFFSKGDGDIIYRIRPGLTFHGGRLQCLCDVSIYYKKR